MAVTVAGAVSLPLLRSSFLPPNTLSSKPLKSTKTKPLLTITTCSSSPSSSSSSSYCHVKPKLVRCPSLDRHATAHNRLRFVRKLTTLLLSKPRHYLPLRILSRCRRYLSLPPSRPLLPFILRYPLLFSLSHDLSPDHLSVSLSPQFLSLLLSSPPSPLPSTLLRLLSLSSHRRLLLSKLVHLAPDLSFPPNFRSCFVNSHPSLFQTLDTSFGRAVQLVAAADSSLSPFPPIPPPPSISPILPRSSPKFKHLSLRRGLNLKRRHRDFLISFHESPAVNPYEPFHESTERRACVVVREVLMMTTGKRTLVDHLTHFRKEFGLPNRLRAMLVRHPEMFYVSVKGERDSVFLVEAFDEKGRLVVEDEMGEVKEKVRELVREGKRLRRERRRGIGVDDGYGRMEEESETENDDEDDGDFEDLFEGGIGDDWEVFGDEEGFEEAKEVMEFWSMKEAREGDDGTKLVEVW